LEDARALAERLSGLAFLDTNVIDNGDDFPKHLHERTLKLQQQLNRHIPNNDSEVICSRALVCPLRHLPS